MNWSDSLSLPRSAVQRSVGYVKDTCALPSCGKKRILSRIGRHPGIRRNDKWFCSGECLSTALLAGLASLPDTRATYTPHRPRFTVGLILLSQRRLTEEQLRTGLEQASRTGELIEEVLVNLGFVTEEQIAAARATQWGYPVFTRTNMAETVESIIPPTLLRTYGAVPLHYSPFKKRVVLGFVARVRHALLSSIELITGNKVEACFITPSELRKQLDRNTSSEFEEVLFEERMTSQEIAETVQRLTGHLLPLEVSFADCGHYFWTRLIGRRRKVDLLFRMNDASEATDFSASERRMGIIQ
jgi:hypothetical protein